MIRRGTPPRRWSQIKILLLATKTSIVGDTTYQLQAGLDLIVILHSCGLSPPPTWPHCSDVAGDRMSTASRVYNSPQFQNLWDRRRYRYGTRSHEFLRLYPSPMRGSIV